MSTDDDNPRLLTRIQLFIRKNLLLLLFTGILFFQVLGWFELRQIKDAIQDNYPCGRYVACDVSIANPVDVGRAIASELKDR